MANLKDKVVLITGAGSGIGAATAFIFAKRGCKLVLNDLTEDRLTDTVSKCFQLGSTPDQVVTVVGDVSEENVPANIIQKTIEKFSQLDVLINNAGIFKMTGVEDSSMERFDQILDINVRSLYRMIQSAVPYLKLSRGSIVNVSSVLSKRAWKNCAAYCISKGAVDQLTKAMAMDLGSYGIRVNCVNPGIIRTNLFANCGLSKEEADLYSDAQYKSIGLDRFGLPEDVAKAIYFLASPKAGFITGASLLVDGGLTLS